MVKLKKAFSGFVDEYKKVKWPKKVKVLEVTIVVLIMTIFVAIFIFGFDYIFNLFINYVTLTLRKMVGGA